MLPFRKFYFLLKVANLKSSPSPGWSSCKFLQLLIVIPSKNFRVRIAPIPSPMSLTHFWVSVTRNMCRNDPQTGQTDVESVIKNPLQTSDSVNQ